MSTKTQTNQSSTNKLNYDPSSLAMYQSLTGGAGGILKGLMNDPFGNALYQMGLGQSQKGAIQGGANNMGVLQQLMKTSGLTGTAGQGFQAAQTAKIGRANQSLMAGANTSNVMNALQRQLQATGMAMSFQPLLKGTSGTSQSTQTQSGLGTWLPQVLGAGLGMASGFMGGGGGMLSAMGGSGGSLPNQATAPSGGYGFGSIPGQTGFAPPPAWMMGG